LFLLTVKDAALGQLAQVAEKHPLCDLRDTLPEFVGPHRAIQQAPQDGALPSAVDNAQRDIDRAWRDFFL